MKILMCKVWLWLVGLSFAALALMLVYGVVRAAICGDSFAQFICGAVGVFAAYFVTLYAAHEVWG